MASGRTITLELPFRTASPRSRRPSRPRSGPASRSTSKHPQDSSRRRWNVGGVVR